MRRRLSILALSISTALALTLAMAGAVVAHGPCDPDGDGTATGREYAQLHIAPHAPHGHGVGGHNPGTHMGFSLCLGVH